MQGKVAIITGAASGIGFAIAQAFAQAGARVVIADLDPVSGEQARAEVEALGGSAAFVKTDVSRAEDVRQLVSKAVEIYGTVDVLVNNAGIQHVAPITDFPEDRWDALIGVMLTGTFLCSKYALPYMIEKKWGRIVNIGSIHSKVASPFKAPYVAAKHGVLGLTRATALEVAAYNITVNAICPTYVRTPLVEKQLATQAQRYGITTEEVITKIMTEPAAIKRLLEPKEVASLALYLCSPQAAGITGAGLDIDLGWTAR
jgi:3-hydroxybutyrate dehydrogenase